MKNAEDYLERTESAIRHLFNAVDSYLEPLRVGIRPIFVSGLPYGPEQDAQYSAWRIENADALEEAKAARRDICPRHHMRRDTTNRRKGFRNLFRKHPSFGRLEPPNPLVFSEVLRGTGSAKHTSRPDCICGSKSAHPLQ